MIVAPNSTSSFFERSLSQMTALRGSAERAQRQISTGQRLERGSDDPLAASRLRMLERDDRLAQVSKENATSASLDLENASATVNEMSLFLIRARELAVQAGNDINNSEGFEAIATELDNIRSSLFDLANYTDGSGNPLFGGRSPAPAFVQDAAGAVTYVGSTAIDSVEIGLGVNVERGVTGPNVVEFDDGGTATNVFAFLGQLAADLRGAASDPAAAARDALAGFESAIETTSRTQTVLGARLAWIDTVQFGAIARDETRAQQQAELGDVDLAEAITQLQQTLTVLEASQASFTRLSSLSLFNQL